MAKTFTNNDMINKVYKMDENGFSIEAVKTMFKNIKHVAIDELKEGKKFIF